MRFAAATLALSMMCGAGCSDYVVARSSFDEAHALPHNQRGSVALQGHRVWDGRDSFISAKNLGAVAHPTADPKKVRVRAMAPMTIGGAILLAIGGVLAVSSLPLFLEGPPPPSKADFPTCFFVCTGQQR